MHLTWMMTGIGIGVVFAILVILVLVLQLFNVVAKKGNNKETIDGIASMPAAQSVEEASELDKAAVATALYLYQKSKGDQESGVLTIKRTPSAWHAVLNERL
ncbi:MAG: OadG family protein [Muribaculaceae bacterium]|nr:OadG family protein [Muribaculaceae bacterium]